MVDDHRVVRDGLASMPGTQDDIEVVGQVANGHLLKDAPSWFGVSLDRDGETSEERVIPR